MAQYATNESKMIYRVSDLTSEPKRMLPPIKGYENQPLVTLEQSIEPLISLVPDVALMVWTVKQNCEEPKDNLTSDESGSIMLYTLEWEPPQSSFYCILNTTLRRQNRSELRTWFLYLRLVIYALAKLPSISSRTIYRGVPIDMSKDFIKDKTFIWWSFSSCTSTLDIIKHFLGNKGPRTIINIECDSAKDISRHSFYQTENELLLYPARQFKVISSLDTGNQLHIVHLKEIQPTYPLIHIPQTTSTIPPIIPVLTANNSYSDQQLKDLIGKCPPRSQVDLGLKNLTDEDMHIVVKEAIINKQCTYLHLISNRVSAVGVEIIAKILNKNTTLQVLSLSYNNVGDIGVHFLTDTLSLNNSSLSTLYLAGTGITDEGAGYLAVMLKTNTVLMYLWLFRNNVRDRGVELLTNTLIHHNKTLKYINLSYNKQTGDGSVNFLTEMLKQNCSLSDLDISDCNFSEKGKESLRQIAQTKRKFTLVI